MQVKTSENMNSKVAAGSALEGHVRRGGADNSNFLAVTANNFQLQKPAEVQGEKYPDLMLGAIPLSFISQSSRQDTQNKF